MSSKTTVNWPFNDVFLLIACFGCKISIFQHTVVRVYYILNFDLPQSLSHGKYCLILPNLAFQHKLYVAIVILGFPWLILVYFSISCCYQLFLVFLRFTSWLRLSNLGFAQLNSADVSVSRESLCNPLFNLVQLSLFLVLISV